MELACSRGEVMVIERESIISGSFGSVFSWISAVIIFIYVQSVRTSGSERDNWSHGV